MFGLTLLLHLITMCSNPGYIKKPKNVGFMKMLEEFDPVLLCPDCEVIRTEKSRHCHVCNQCVERFDHHCPWINNCVGTNNHGVFLWFLTSMFVLLVMTMTVLLSNDECHKNIDKSRDSGFLIPMILPDIFYKETITVWLIYSCVSITALFTLPVT